MRRRFLQHITILILLAALMPCSRQSALEACVIEIARDLRVIIAGIAAAKKRYLGVSDVLSLASRRFLDIFRRVLKLSEPLWNAVTNRWCPSR